MIRCTILMHHCTALILPRKCPGVLGKILNVTSLPSLSLSICWTTPLIRAISNASNIRLMQHARIETVFAYIQCLVNPSSPQPLVLIKAQLLVSVKECADSESPARIRYGAQIHRYVTSTLDCFMWFHMIVSRFRLLVLLVSH